MNVKPFVAFLFVFCGCLDSACSQDQCALAKGALEIASQIRGLEIKRPVGCKLLNQTEFRDSLQNLIANDLDRRNLENEEKAFKLLGLVPNDYRYAHCLIDAYTIESAAFYSSRGGYFVIPDWMPISLAVLVHEATHALQDQHFDLRKIDNSTTLFSDPYLAVSALIEGDALWVERKFRNQSPERAGYEPTESDMLPLADPNCKIPETLDKLLYFEYEYGFEFVDRLRKQGSNSTVDSAFRSPPRSTRAILHADEPRAHRLNTFGEYMTRVLLLKWTDPKSAVHGSAGLHADAVQMHDREVSWRTEWDSPKDAQEFVEAVQKMVEKRFDLILDRHAAWVQYSAGDIRGSIRVYPAKTVTVTFSN